MYELLIPFHSLFRWLVLLSLIYAIVSSITGYLKKSRFTKSNDNVRHWTATIAHVQLMIGILLYTKSWAVKAYFSGQAGGSTRFETAFFSVIHLSLMLIAIVLITIGSAKAKRKTESKDKFKTIVIWFTIALIVILLAIPWPFSPLSIRPYFRNFNL